MEKEKYIKPDAELMELEISDPIANSKDNDIAGEYIP